jgi:hypothetical protein
MSPVPCALSGVFLCAAAAADVVATYDVGSGDLTAEIQFDFFNGNTHLYTLHWDGALTGREVFDVLLSEQPDVFAFEYESYSFGDFLTGVWISDDFDSGVGTPPDYIDFWHYWTREEGEKHASSMIGFGDRVLQDGSADAWVFGHDGAPATIPAPSAVALLLLASGRRRRRRRSAT